jgi:folate-binding protein YgfZ
MILRHPATTICIACASACPRVRRRSFPCQLCRWRAAWTFTAEVRSFRRSSLTPVDFRKGCFLGQELTVRTYHTGMTRKRILPIRLIPLNAAETPLREFLIPSSSTPPVSLSKPEPVDLVYHPPVSSASQKTRSAGKILSLHPAVTSVGLALVRLEMAERCWWSGDIASGTVGEWLSSGVGRLTAAIGGAEWGVYVDKGEAYAAALDHVDA